MSLLSELKRRNVLRVSVAYLAGAWLLLQIAATVLPPLGSPDWVMQALIYCTALGFPFAVVLAWIYEWTPKGIVTTADADSASIARPASRRRFDLAVFAVMALAIVVLVVDNYMLADDARSDERPYVLVVPFDVSAFDGASWRPFADQVTREIIRNLRKVSGLRIVPPPSAFAFAADKTRANIRNRIPDVGYVLDGLVSIERGNSMRIALELEDVGSDSRVIWDDEFFASTDDATELFDVQSSVAKAVSGSLEVQLVDREVRELDAEPTANRLAYSLFLDGLGQQALATNESLIRSIELFDAAIEQDPGFTLAHIAKADSYRLRMGYYEAPIDMLSHVRAAATDALAIDPDSAEARSTLGLAYLHAWRWQDAWRYLNDARDRDPMISLTHLGFALYYSALGEAQKMREALALADELDPLNPEIADWGQFAITMIGDYEAAMSWVEQKARVFPNVGFFFAGGSAPFSLAGRHDDAIRLAEEGARLEQRSPFSLAFLAQAYAAAGRAADARAALAESERGSAYTCPYETALAYVALGDLDRGFELLLNEAVPARSNCLIFTRQDPRLEPLRGDPRFTQLLDTIGLGDDAVRALPR